MNLVDGWQCEGEIGRLMLILEQACTHDRVGRELEEDVEKVDYDSYILLYWLNCGAFIDIL